MFFNGVIGRRSSERPAPVSARDRNFVIKMIVSLRYENSQNMTSIGPVHVLVQRSVIGQMNVTPCAGKDFKELGRRHTQGRKKSSACYGKNQDTFVRLVQHFKCF
eukprot:GILJ01017963.1.p1 GENE.GILJ01017963.1~~GILJ01017963.1.p1  ORF type:complete len:105 (+),score=0.92 GILJ01017963.1:390-704(+)